MSSYPATRELGSCFQFNIYKKFLTNKKADGLPWVSFIDHKPTKRKTYLCANTDTKYAQVLLWDVENNRWEDMDGYTIEGVTHYTTFQLPKESE